MQFLLFWKNILLKIYLDSNIWRVRSRTDYQARWSKQICFEIMIRLWFPYSTGVCTLNTLQGARPYANEHISDVILIIYIRYIRLCNFSEQILCTKTVIFLVSSGVVLCIRYLTVFTVKEIVITDSKTAQNIFLTQICVWNIGD